MLSEAELGGSGSLPGRWQGGAGWLWLTSTRSVIVSSAGMAAGNMARQRKVVVVAGEEP